MVIEVKKDSGTLQLYRNTTPFNDYESAITHAKTISGLADGQPCLVRYFDEKGKPMAIIVLGGTNGMGNAIIDYGEVEKLKTDVTKLEQQPTVGSHSLTIKQNGTTKGVFDGLTDEEIDIEIPTKVSELVNDESFVTSSDLNGYGYVKGDDIADMATKTWVNGEGFLKEHQSLDGYAKLTDVTKYFDGVDYVKDRKEIQFKNNGSVLATIDTTDFIKDGMIDNVSLTKGTNSNIGQDVLKITFNTDAGKEPIELPIENIFKDAVYTQKEANDKFATKTELATKADRGEVYTKDDVYTKTEVDDKFATKGSLGDYVAKADLKTLTVQKNGMSIGAYSGTNETTINIDLNDYYTKTETYSQTEVDNKLKDIDVTEQLKDYYKKSETYSQTEINTQLENYVTLLGSQKIVGEKDFSNLRISNGNDYDSTPKLVAYYNHGSDSKHDLSLTFTNMHLYYSSSEIGSKRVLLEGDILDCGTF